MALSSPGSSETDNPRRRALRTVSSVPGSGLIFEGCFSISETGRFMLSENSTIVFRHTRFGLYGAALLKRLFPAARLCGIRAPWRGNRVTIDHCRTVRAEGSIVLIDLLDGPRDARPNPGMLSALAASFEECGGRVIGELRAFPNSGSVPGKVGISRIAPPRAEAAVTDETSPLLINVPPDDRHALGLLVCVCAEGGVSPTQSFASWRAEIASLSHMFEHWSAYLFDRTFAQGEHATEVPLELIAERLSSSFWPDDDLAAKIRIAASRRARTECLAFSGDSAFTPLAQGIVRLRLPDTDFSLSLIESAESETRRRIAFKVQSHILMVECGADQRFFVVNGRAIYRNEPWAALDAVCSMVNETPSGWKRKDARVLIGRLAHISSDADFYSAIDGMERILGGGR